MHAFTDEWIRAWILGRLGGWMMDGKMSSYVHPCAAKTGCSHVRIAKKG